MKRLIFPLLLFSLSLPLHAESKAPADARELVLIPAKPLAILRADMVQHMLDLDRLVALLGEGKFDEAADLAETKLGRSSMGKHLDTGTPPGRYMSPSMRELAWGMHDAASDFAEVARKRDLTATLSALGRLTTRCSACHLSYRVR